MRSCLLLRGLAAIVNHRNSVRIAPCLPYLFECHSKGFATRMAFIMGCIENYWNLGDNINFNTILMNCLQIC